MSWLAALLLSYLVTSGAWLPVSQASVIVFNTATNHTVVVYDSALADFGNKLHGKLLGNLSVAQPETACAPLLAPPGGVMAHFVLIRRGNCSFSDKVRHAQQARYAAAIIYNVNSDDIFHMQGEDASDVTITSMMVGATCAHSIRQFLQSDRYIVVLTGWSPGDATDYLIPFIGVCLLCIAIMSCFLVHRCYQHYQRVRRSRLPARALASLPVKLYDKSASSSDTQQYDTCAICLEDFEQNDRLRILPCNHAYHCVCIDPWLTRSRRVCPICKRSVLASVFGSAGHSDSSSLEEEEDDDGNDDAGVDEDSSSVSAGHGERRPLINAGSAGTAAGRGRSVASARRAAASSATSYGSTRPTSHSVAPTHPSSSSRSSTLSSMTSRLPFRLFRRAETSLSSTEVYDGGDGGVMSGGVGVVAPSEPLLAHESSAQHTTTISGVGRRSRHHPPPQSQSVTAARQTATAAAASETAQGLSVVVVQAAAVERAPPATSSAVAVARPARRRRDRRRPVVSSRGPVESQRGVSAGHENVTEDVITSPAAAVAAAASQEDGTNTTSADCIV